MPMRLGPGPVFVYEWLTAARRWQLYVMRAGFIGTILIGLCLVWNQLSGNRPPDARASIEELARYGSAIYRTIALVELTLILLAAPAATAGAVCLDKARGTLDHMLATDLSNAEIVLGKLGVRLIPVLGLIACLVPVVALTSLLGGIDPLALLGSFLVAIGCAFVGCSLAMALSVHGRKTHEVLIMTYVLIVLWVLGPALLALVNLVLTGRPRGIIDWSLREWLEWSNPYYLVLVPYLTPGRVDVMTYLRFVAGCLAFSAVLVVLATARIRRVVLVQAGRPAAGARRRPSWLRRLISTLRLPGPSLDFNPVAWREWHRTRPSLMMRVAWGLYAALGLLWVYLTARPSNVPAPMRVEMVGVMNGFQVSVGLLLLSVGAAASLAEERARGSLDVLLSTPMSTRAILAGKWWGSFRRVFSVAIWPAGTSLLLAHDRGHWVGFGLLLGLVLAYGAAITSLGLAAATWVRRLGRAVAFCVTGYVLFLVIWPIWVVSAAGQFSENTITAMMMGDPPYGAFIGSLGASASIFPRGDSFRREDLYLGMFAWIVAHIAVAACVFLATLATFDHCVGRVREGGTSPPLRPPLTHAELLAMVPTARGEYEEGPESDLSESDDP